MRGTVRFGLVAAGSLCRVCDNCGAPPHRVSTFGCQSPGPGDGHQVTNGKTVTCKPSPFPRLLRPLAHRGHPRWKTVRAPLLYLKVKLTPRGSFARPRSASRISDVVLHSLSSVALPPPAPGFLRGARVAASPLKLLPAPPSASLLPLQADAGIAPPEGTVPVLSGCAGSAVPARRGRSAGAAPARW